MAGSQAVVADLALFLWRVKIKSVYTVDLLDLAKTHVKSEREKIAKFRQLKASLENLSCKFKARPPGAFHDEANGVLLIVAVDLTMRSNLADDGRHMIAPQRRKSRGRDSSMSQEQMRPQAACEQGDAWKTREPK